MPEHDRRLILRDPELLNLEDNDETVGRGHLSHSAIGTLLACEQRFKLHYESGLRPAVTATPLALGRAFATALETGDPQIGYDLVLADHAAEVAANAGNPWAVSVPREEAETGAVTVRAASRAYLKRYGQHGETRELTLRARIRNPAPGGRYSLSHDLVGRVDAVDLDNRVLIEDKLASSQSKVGLDRRVKLDRQVSIETYLIWRCTGVLIDKVHYRVTSKPGIRQRQNETHDQFLERLEGDYAERPEFYLTEELAERTRIDFLRLETELWRWAEMVRSARTDRTWPRNTSACLEHGSCRFLPLCADEPGAYEQFRRVETAEEMVSA